MQFSSWYGGKTPICALKHLITHKACAEPFRPVKQKIVGFRLRMPVRQITGPVAPVIEHLSQHHIGPGCDVMVEDRIDTPFSHIPEFTHAGIFPGRILRAVKHGCEFCFVFSTLYEDFTVLLRFHGGFGFRTDMQAPWPLCEYILSGYRCFFSVPAKPDFSRKQKDCRFLSFSQEASLFPIFHPVNADIHPHFAVFIIISRQNFFPVLIEHRISEYFSHPSSSRF